MFLTSEMAETEDRDIHIILAVHVSFAHADLKAIQKQLTQTFQKYVISLWTIRQIFIFMKPKPNPKTD